MIKYHCIEKLRKDNGTIYGYTLKNVETGATLSVAAHYLKTAILQKNATVDNLTLTSDFRLIDSVETKDNSGLLDSIQHDGRSRFINKINKEYGNGQLHQGKLNYSISKLRSHRVGKLVASCLMMGIAASTMTGCGVTTEASAMMEEKEPQYESLQDLIENANTVYLDAKHVKLSKISIVIRDKDGGDEYGTLKGEVLKIPGFDKLTLYDNDENIIAESKEKPGLNHSTWCIENSGSGVQYLLDGKLSIVFDKYNILDQDAEVIGYVKEAMALGSQFNVYNNDDVLIATITQDPFRSDMYITFTEDCNLDKENLVIITASIMENNVKQREAKQSKSDSDKE